MNRDFIVTKEHRRFTEFAGAIRKDVTPPGSARPFPPAATPTGTPSNPSSTPGGHAARPT